MAKQHLHLALTFLPLAQYYKHRNTTGFNGSAIRRVFAETNPSLVLPPIFFGLATMKSAHTGEGE